VSTSEPSASVAVFERRDLPSDRVQMHSQGGADLRRSYSSVRAPRFGERDAHHDDMETGRAVGKLVGLP